jgi:hypothetical protein
MTVIPKNEHRTYVNVINRLASFRSSMALEASPGWGVLFFGFKNLFIDNCLGDKLPRQNYLHTFGSKKPRRNVYMQSCHEWQSNLILQCYSSRKVSADTP